MRLSNEADAGSPANPRSADLAAYGSHSKLRARAPRVACVSMSKAALCPLSHRQTMSFEPTKLVKQITSLHRETVVRWHQSEPDNVYTDFLGMVCQQHQFNYLLWHEEDIARSGDVSDARIAMVKRAIDGYNQQRNDWIERMDEAIIDMLADAGAVPSRSARLNTETPGSAIDRLSIMSLRIYHLAEQLDRTDVDQAHLERVSARLERCRVQQADLSQSLAELLADLAAGRKMLKVYRQMKMYNDPTLNPYLYRREQKAGCLSRRSRSCGHRVATQNAILSARNPTMSTVPHASRMHRPGLVATIAARPFTPRRVLQVITPSHMSGAETQVVRVTRRMRERGHTMPVLVKHGSPAVAEMRSRGFDVETARIGGKANVLAIAALARAARRHQCDLLQSNLSTASWWAGWLETVGGPKSVGHVHGFTSAAGTSRQSHLLAVSGAVRDDLVEQGIPRERITVLWNALDADEFRPTRDPLAVRAEFGADATTPVIGTFGHLSVKKGHRELFCCHTAGAQGFPERSVLDHRPGRPTGRARRDRSRRRLLRQRPTRRLSPRRRRRHERPRRVLPAVASRAVRPGVCRSGSVGQADRRLPKRRRPRIDRRRRDRIVGPALRLRRRGRGASGAARKPRHRCPHGSRRADDRARDLFNWPKYIAALEGVYDRVLG